jgi:DNA invertase Pin-like site-specific DNA recombinase
VGEKVAALIAKRPEVEQILQEVQEARADLFITLKKDRTTKTGDFERELTPALQQIADARVTFRSSSIRVLLRAVRSRSCSPPPIPRSWRPPPRSWSSR